MKIKITDLAYKFHVIINNKDTTIIDLCNDYNSSIIIINNIGVEYKNTAKSVSKCDITYTNINSDDFCVYMMQKYKSIIYDVINKKISCRDIWETLKRINCVGYISEIGELGVSFEFVF